MTSPTTTPPDAVESADPQAETATERAIREMVIEHPNPTYRGFFAGLYGVDLDGNPISEAERRRIAERRIVVYPS